MTEEELEKKAEEYAEGTKTEEELKGLETVHYWGQESLTPDERRLFGGIQDRKRARKQGFKDGAKFGYNKANEWHKQDIDDIYDLILKDWNIKYFICIMKDKHRVMAIGLLDEYTNGDIGVNVIFDNDDEKYYIDDIVWWKEIILPKESE